MYYQLSYPRSGASYLRFISRHLLNIDKEYLEIDRPNDLYIKTHRVNEIKDDSKLITILRNPLECIMRHEGHMTQKYIIDYSQVLSKYHNFNGRKLLIYYEDLISNPLKQVENLCKFFVVPNNIDDLHNITKFSLSAYSCSHGSYTKGEKNTYHSIGLEEHWFDKVKEHCHFEYLERYFA